MPELNIALAQINPLVGDIDGNVEKVIAFSTRAKSEYGADLVLFPELTLTGYPPEDLLLRPSLALRVEQALARLKTSIPSDLAVVVGYPSERNGKLLNMAGVVVNGECAFEYAKRCLPNYQVFDEKRYFSEGDQHSQFEFNGFNIGLSICEDIWDGAPIAEMQHADLDLVLNLNASPFHKNKQTTREALVSDRAVSIDAPIFYVNQVGGQDELVFDGGTMIFDRQGKILARAPLFDEHLLCVRYSTEGKSIRTLSAPALSEPGSELAVIYQALVLGVRDYVNKNGFKGVVLGLSGGIDSALTLAIAVDALGADRVEAVMMPFTYTSDLSKNDAEDEARRLGVRYRSISIENIYSAFNDSLNEAFSGHSADKTEENIQARSRGVLLMALSNKLGYLVLTTGNKSEMAVGYATLYGDMAGGLDVLKDVPKTVVFELSRYRNTLSEVIPESVITRPPSAELAPDQKDEDTLPPYDVLDQILEMYIEQDMSADAIVERGFDSESVRQVLRMVDLNEYKRRQAPIGIRISERAFGRDRRYPITNGWKIGL
jgi:NAD+ synthase (glutamine-hydrolysing)